MPGANWYESPQTARSRGRNAAAMEHPAAEDLPASGVVTLIGQPSDSDNGAGATASQTDRPSLAQAVGRGEWQHD